MENLINLKNAQLNKVAIVERIEKNITPEVKHRLEELGFVKNMRVRIIHRSRLAKCGITIVQGSKICLDDQILSSIWVRQL